MFDFDLGGTTAAGIDQFAKTGGLLPAGRYHVRLDGVSDTPPAKSSGNVGQDLTFVVVGGPFAGSEVKETLWPSDKPAGKNRLILFGSRLGLLRKKGDGFERVEGKGDFKDCLGAECVIEVVQEEYTRKDGSKGKKAAMTFSGIWAVNDPEVKSVAKAKPGQAPPPRQAVDTAAL